MNTRKRSTLLLFAGGLVLVAAALVTVLSVRFSLNLPKETLSISPLGSGILLVKSPGAGEEKKSLKPGERTALTLDDFQALELAGSWIVEIIPGEGAAGFLTAPQHEPFYLEVLQEGGVTKVRLTEFPGSSSWNGPEARLELTVAGLRSLVLSGSNRVELKGLKTDDLEIVLSGAGQLTGQGETETLKLITSGATDVDFSRFTSKQVEVIGSGAGNLELFVPGGRVSGQLSGMVNLDLLGDPPQVNVQTSGLSRVTKE